jgi:hypothetical protein
MEDKSLDDRLRQLLEELSSKLGEVIADSPEVGEKLDRIRSSGYSLYLLLDCKPLPGGALPSRSSIGRDGGTSASTEGEEVSWARDRQTTDSEAAPHAGRPLRPAPAAPRKQLAEASGVFRINAGDLAFFRSLGIDPTRRCRGSKRRSGTDG